MIEDHSTAQRRLGIERAIRSSIWKEAWGYTFQRTSRSISLTDEIFDRTANPLAKMAIATAEKL